MGGFRKRPSPEPLPDRSESPARDGTQAISRRSSVLPAFGRDPPRARADEATPAVSDRRGRRSGNMKAWRATLRGVVKHDPEPRPVGSCGRNPAGQAAGARGRGSGASRRFSGPSDTHALAATRPASPWHRPEGYRAGRLPSVLSRTRRGPGPFKRIRYPGRHVHGRVHSERVPSDPSSRLPEQTVDSDGAPCFDGDHEDPAHQQETADRAEVDVGGVVPETQSSVGIHGGHSSVPARRDAGSADLLRCASRAP